MDGSSDEQVPAIQVQVDDRAALSKLRELQARIEDLSTRRIQP